MAQKHRYNNNKKRQNPLATPRAPLVRETYAAYEKKPPTQYGKPFILMEDENKNTFEFKGGAWVPHDRSIADCRQDCQVTELQQKVNRMTRYEIRCILPTTA